MSAPRPRPVTATITRLDHQKVSYRASYTSAVSSGSSTDSLVSGVDLTRSLPSESSIASSSESPAARDRVHVTENERMAENKTSDGALREDSCSAASGSRMSTQSPWESWLLQKAMQEREKQKRKEEEQQQALEDDRKEQEKKTARKSKIEHVLAEWQKAKQEEEHLKRQEAIKKKQEADAAAQKKKANTELAAEKFKNWLTQKRKDELRRKAEEKERLQRQAIKMQEKRQDGEAAFREWCATLASRARPTTSASGRCNSFDSYPKPTFCNPVAWQPVCAPSGETKIVKKGSQRRQMDKKNAKRNPWSIDNL